MTTRLFYSQPTTFVFFFSFFCDFVCEWERLRFVRVLVTLVVRLIKCMLILLFIHYRRATLNYMHLVVMIYLLIIFRRVRMSWKGEPEFQASIQQRDNLLKSFFLYFCQIRRKFLSQELWRERRMIYENLLQVEKEWKTTQNITEGLMRRFWLSLLWSFDCFPLSTWTERALDTRYNVWQNLCGNKECVVCVINEKNIFVGFIFALHVLFYSINSSKTKKLIKMWSERFFNKIKVDVFSDILINRKKKAEFDFWRGK